MSDTHRLGFVKGLIPSKSDLMNGLKLGLGAAGAITVTDLLLSRVLVRNGMPLVPMSWNPVAIPFGSWLLSKVAKQVKLGDKVADGMLAGGVGVGLSALLARFTTPSMAVSTTAAQTTEESGEGIQGVQGFGFGRAFAPGVAGGRLGALRRTRGGTMLYGVGTPDMRAARMLSGATVAIEDSSQLRGATVAFEESGNGFASALT